jgi:hypothetical protein
MADKRNQNVRRVRLPGFLADEEVGLGTAVSRMTSALHVRSCGGCQRRAAALDRRVVLYSRNGRAASRSTGAFDSGGAR